MSADRRSFFTRLASAGAGLWAAGTRAIAQQQQPVPPAQDRPPIHPQGNRFMVTGPSRAGSCGTSGSTRAPSSGDLIRRAPFQPGESINHGAVFCRLAVA